VSMELHGYSWQPTLQQPLQLHPSKQMCTMTRSVLQSFQSSKSLAWQCLNLYQHCLQGYVLFLSIFYLFFNLCSCLHIKNVWKFYFIEYFFFILCLCDGYKVNVSLIQKYVLRLGF
jgi:hypothetical protein